MESIPKNYVMTSERLPAEDGMYKTIARNSRGEFYRCDQVFFTDSGFWRETVAWDPTSETIVNRLARVVNEWRDYAILTDDDLDVISQAKEEIIKLTMIKCCMVEAFGDYHATTITLKGIFDELDDFEIKDPSRTILKERLNESE